MTRNSHRPLFGQAACLCGLAGVAIILLGSIVSGLSYEGRTGEAYSPVNHFVSELGDARYAARAWAFNGGLFVGGLLLIAFMLGVTAHIPGWFRYVFGLVALVTGVSDTLVGLLPSSADLESHATAALRWVISVSLYLHQTPADRVSTIERTIG